MIRSSSLVRSLLGEPGPRRNIKVALAVLALFDLLFYLFAIGPLGESERDRRMQVDNLGRLVQTRTAEVDKLAAIVAKVQSARDQGDQLLGDITLSRRTAFSSIVSELDQAGKEAGVELRERSYNTEPIEGSDTLSIMTVTAGLEGNYENLVRFLNRLDRSPRFLIVESLGASPQQAGQKLNVSLKLDVFVSDERGAAE